MKINMYGILILVTAIMFSIVIASQGCIVEANSDITEFTLKLNCGWNLFSLPVDPGTRNVTEIFGNIGYFVIYKWDSINKKYSVVREIVPGEGYWILVLNNVNVTIQGNPVNEFNIQLSGGWNLIGSVYGTNGLIEDLANKIYNKVYVWDRINRKYLALDSIPPGEGAWILAFEPCIIRVFTPRAIPNGPWIDELIITQDNDLSRIIDMLENNQIQAYLSPITDLELMNYINQSSIIRYNITYGAMYELTFNPAKFNADKGFSPFNNCRIREAMNYIVNRSYILNDIFMKWGSQKWTPFIKDSPEYGRLIDIIRLIELKYPYNFSKGNRIIYDEMTNMSAILINGKWYYPVKVNGNIEYKPVIIKVLIREEDKRRLIGEYIASQLERLNFTVERIYGSFFDLFPIVFLGDPKEGEWHIYTGGWIGFPLGRDESDLFAFFYTPHGFGNFMQYSNPSPEFLETSEKLFYKNWNSWNERMNLMRNATLMAMNNSLRVWLSDNYYMYICRKEIESVFDLNFGFGGAIWSRTVRYRGQIGGTINAINRKVLIDPWNPVDSPMQLYDFILMNYIGDNAFINHPYTGLPLPNRVVNVTLFIEKDIPVISSSPWIEIVKVDEIRVPEDALYAWNASLKVWEYAPPNTYAKAKVVVNYGSILGQVKYQDNTSIAIADWLMDIGLKFERACPSSKLYDESVLNEFKTWRDNFRGMRIISEDPLVIEWYTNYTNQEAELIAEYAAYWPDHPWHTIAIGILAEENELLAFSKGKAEDLGVEWMNYINGSSLDILHDCLDEAINENYIPPWISDYVTPSEANYRYSRLKDWYTLYHNFWVVSGPYILYYANYTEHKVILKAWRAYPFKANRFSYLIRALIPKVTLQGPNEINLGETLEYDVIVTYNGLPYPSSMIVNVKYVIIDLDELKIAYEECAEYVGEGYYKIVFDTSLLDHSGKYRLIAIVYSTEVAKVGLDESNITVIGS